MEVIVSRFCYIIFSYSVQSIEVSVAVESSESSRVGNSDVTRSNELHRVVTRELNEL